MFFGTTCFSELPISTIKPTAWNGDASDVNFIIDQLFQNAAIIDQRLENNYVIDQLLDNTFKIDQDSVYEAGISKEVTTGLVR